MNIIDSTNKILEAKALIDTAVKPTLEALKDTSIPLADRWDAFTKLVTNNIFVNEKTYGDGFLDVLAKGKDFDLTLYDDFNIDRYQTSTFVEMYDHIMDGGEYDEFLVTAREANLSKWQEAVLASGFSGFQYDW